MTSPKYRADIAGQVKEFIADLEIACRSELAHGDNFTLSVEDVPAYADYKDWLTEREMQAAFKRAQRF
jgi:hypothetical protein